MSEGGWKHKRFKLTFYCREFDQTKTYFARCLRRYERQGIRSGRKSFFHLQKNISSPIDRCRSETASSGERSSSECNFHV